MSHIITADIRGFRYYLKIKDKGWGDLIFTYEGLKNNASKYTTKELPEAFVEIIKSPWEMKVIGY